MASIGRSQLMIDENGIPVRSLRTNEQSSDEIADGEQNLLVGELAAEKSKGIERAVELRAADNLGKVEWLAPREPGRIAKAILDGLRIDALAVDMDPHSRGGLLAVAAEDEVVPGSRRQFRLARDFE